jgi:hypothetical protein
MHASARAIINALGRLPYPAVFRCTPVRAGAFRVRVARRGALRMTQPMSYLQMLRLVADARAVH